MEDLHQYIRFEGEVSALEDSLSQLEFIGVQWGDSNSQTCRLAQRMNNIKRRVTVMSGKIYARMHYCRQQQAIQIQPSYGEVTVEIEEEPDAEDSTRGYSQ